MSLMRRIALCSQNAKCFETSKPSSRMPTTLLLLRYKPFSNHACLHPLSPTTQVARHAIGILTTENRRTWSSLRRTLSEDCTNADCLRIVDDALFIVCLDDATPSRPVADPRHHGHEDLAALCSNFLCGTYDLREGVQVGTCTNRWYDKVSIQPFLSTGHLQYPRNSFR